MLDFHSHILPKMDDGAQSCRESRELLTLLAKQGVTAVAATPHFSANRCSVTAFLEERQASYDRLLQEGPTEIPVLLGAEVSFYNGISQMNDPHRLCLADSDLLLLEMPMQPWPDWMINEVVNLSFRGGLTVVLAHVERFLPLQSKQTVRRLLSNNVLFQVNADSFLSPFFRCRLLKQFMQGQVHFLGTDCHNVTSRPPKMDKAMAVLERKCGKETVSRWLSHSENLLRAEGLQWRI